MTGVAVYAIHQLYTASQGGKACTGKKETCTPPYPLWTYVSFAFTILGGGGGRCGAYHLPPPAAPPTHLHT
jgi:hypothetical protein